MKDAGDASARLEAGQKRLIWISVTNLVLSLAIFLKLS
jgi:hypothetical protein